MSDAKRISKSDIYNLLQLAYHLPETIPKVDLYPDTSGVVGMKEVTGELNQLLGTKSGKLLGYDTTFKLGHFCVSSLVFRYSMFNEESLIPVAFLTHDRKFQVHEHYLVRIRPRWSQIDRYHKCSPKGVPTGICPTMLEGHGLKLGLSGWCHCLQARYDKPFEE